MVAREYWLFGPDSAFNDVILSYILHIYEFLQINFLKKIFNSIIAYGCTYCIYVFLFYAIFRDLIFISLEFTCFVWYLQTKPQTEI